MILHIDDFMSIADLQEKFSECFPVLKIEFYRKPHHYESASPEAQHIHPDIKIGDIRKNHHHGELVIESWYKAGEVEKDFKKIFGLNVQVFRKENGAWVQTSKTDKCSLKELSELSSYGDHSMQPRYEKQFGSYNGL